MSKAPHITRHLKGKDIHVYYTELRGRYDSLVKKASKVSRCLQCDEDYHPADNLLRRDCWMHTGRFRPTLDGFGTWSCCGNIHDVVGCVSCAHTDNTETLRGMHANPWHSYIEIPREVLDFSLLRYNANIIEDYPEGGPSNEGRDGIFYHIRRVVVD